MNSFLKRAEEIKDTIIKDRRTIHGYAEREFDLEKTVAYVCKNLKEADIEPKIVGKSGITCLIGNGKGKTILIRGDMDALPMKEESGLDFAATNGNCHSCGHDSHTAMLLAAAKLLKERESEINGYVKFMFQPAEEILAGANDMIENGILENPHVDAAMGIHIEVGKEDTTLCHTTYGKGSYTFSGDFVRIKIRGNEAHGSRPESGVDAINIAAHTVIALQEIIAREISCKDNAVVLVGKISGGTSCNTESGDAELEVSVRATTEEQREFLKNRVKEIAECTAATFRGKADVEFVYGIPPLVTDADLSTELAKYFGEIVGEENMVPLTEVRCGTEDFTAVASKVPSAYYNIGAGSIGEGYIHGQHHPAMVINEDVLPYGAAAYANCAYEYLKNNK